MSATFQSNINPNILECIANTKIQDVLLTLEIDSTLHIHNTRLNGIRQHLAVDAYQTDY